MKSARHTAGILAAMFSEFDQPRMRVSRKTLKVIGNRKRLKDAFVYEVSSYLSELEVEFIEIDRGYCLIRASTLNGAKPFTYKKFKTNSHLNLCNEEEIWEFLENEYEIEDEDEDD